MVTALKISRAQLAKICGNDHDMIRQFETLFSAVASQDTDAEAVEPEIQIETAGNLALALIERLERASQAMECSLQMLELAPSWHVHSISDVNGLQVAINAISDSYSTSESLTNRKWIDGKSIYRKVVSLGTLPNNVAKAVAHGITNMSTLVQLYGVTKNPTSGLILSLPFASPAGALYTVSLSVDSTNINVDTGSDRTAFTTTYAIVEYTKTS